ncbi:IPT/TIG domain-containing protein [Actinoplanes solisilvae]|uniref:IPT/TIG domain-containing protein n=1 Tax=Actinoplanes solisilvae TaxID=2486853 RepID=UPI000FD80717|nr:IPT/TIG domain-containing protein [Actinoplanes solisilvae]
MSHGKLHRASCAATILIAAAVSVLAATGPASAASLMALSSPAGRSGGGNTLVGTVGLVPGVSGPFAAGTKPTVQFQFYGTGTSASACNAKAKAVAQIGVAGVSLTAGVLTVDPAQVTRITATKIAFRVPSSSYPALDGGGVASTINTSGLSLVGDQTVARWNVCVYDSDSIANSNLLASSSYTVAVKPTIASILPAGSSAGGGQSITVTGTGFSTITGTITGAVGGVPLSGVKVAADGKSFTAITGARVAAAGLALTVDGPGGTVSSLDPDNNPATNDIPIPFTYNNSVTVTPNTAVTGSTVVVDVMGAGFSALDFDTSGTAGSSDAHVFLVKDAYDAAGNRGVAECIVDAVVRDTELLCTLTLAGVPDGAYTLTVVENGDPGAGVAANPSLVTSGAVFVVAPY